MPTKSMGFCVASTIKGWGRRRVTPSTVTWPSSITSSRLDWVLGEVRLISSARRIWVITTPGLNSISPVCMLYMVKPVTSEGVTSGVN